jgi:gas vesicle protein
LQKGPEFLSGPFFSMKKLKLTINIIIYILLIASNLYAGDWYYFCNREDALAKRDELGCSHKNVSYSSDGCWISYNDYCWNEFWYPKIGSSGPTEECCSVYESKGCSVDGCVPECFIDISVQNTGNFGGVGGSVVTPGGSCSDELGCSYQDVSCSGNVTFQPEDCSFVTHHEETGCNIEYNDPENYGDDKSLSFSYDCENGDSISINTYWSGITYDDGGHYKSVDALKEAAAGAAGSYWSCGQLGDCTLEEETNDGCTAEYSIYSSNIYGYFTGSECKVWTGTACMDRDDADFSNQCDKTSECYYDDYCVRASQCEPRTCFESICDKNKCEYIPIPGCDQDCTDDTDCNDLNDATADSCGPDGKCKFEIIDEDGDGEADKECDVCEQIAWLKKIYSKIPDDEDIIDEIDQIAGEVDDALKDNFDDVVTEVDQVAGEVDDALKDNFDDVVTEVDQVAGEVDDALKDNFDDVVTEVDQVAGEVDDALKDNFDDVVTEVDEVAGEVDDALKDNFDDVVTEVDEVAGEVDDELAEGIENVSVDQSALDQFASVEEHKPEEMDIQSEFLKMDLSVLSILTDSGMEMVNPACSFNVSYMGRDMEFSICSLDSMFNIMGGILLGLSKLYALFIIFKGD